MTYRIARVQYSRWGNPLIINVLGLEGDVGDLITALSTNALRIPPRETITTSELWIDHYDEYGPVGAMGLRFRLEHARYILRFLGFDAAVINDVLNDDWMADHAAELRAGQLRACLTIP